MTDTARIADTVARLLAARTGSGPLVEADAAGEPRSIAEAFAIQSGVIGGLKAKVGGWKVGRAGPDAPLVYSPIVADLIRSAPDTRQPAEARLRGLELEIAFRIDGVLPATDDSDFMRKLADVVTPLPAFEVVDSRLADPQGASALWKLADFQINAGLIYGTPPAKGWHAEDFAKPGVRLTANDETVCDGPATLNTGTPFGMLADLIRECRHLGGVQPGQIVTTGSFTGLRYFAAGTTLTGGISGMTPITMTFAA